MTDDLIRIQARIDQELTTWQNVVRDMARKSVMGLEPSEYGKGLKMMLEEADRIFADHRINELSLLVVSLARLKFIELLHEYACRAVNGNESDE